MKFDKVSIRQIADDYAYTTGLHKYGRSKMPSTVEYLQVAYGPDGRAVTGLDDEAYEVNVLADEEERAEKKKELTALRHSLERLLGGVDLSATSSFWETYGITIPSDEELILNRINPKHVLMYHALIANGYVAPDRESAALPKYRSAKYYFHSEEQAVVEEVKASKARDKAKARLVAISEDCDRMILIGQYLEGDKYKAGMKEDRLYSMLSQFIENPKEPDNFKLFSKAADAPVEDLQFKVTIDRAIKKKLIRFHDGYYQRGKVTLGKNPQEVYRNLQKPEYATEFLSIQEELS